MGQMQYRYTVEVDPGTGRTLADPLGKGGFRHAVLDSQGANLEQTPCRAVGLFRRVRGGRAGLFGESKVGVARAVGFHHCPVARQRRGNAEFLLFPIDVSQGLGGVRADQPAEPGRGAEDESAVAGSIPAGPGAERGQ